MIALGSQRGLGKLQLGAVLPQLIDLLQCLHQPVRLSLRGLVRRRFDGIKLLLHPRRIATFAIDLQEKAPVFICRPLRGITGRFNQGALQKTEKIVR